MRIYTRAGDLAFKLFAFPDGQPHFKLETYEREFDAVTIETRISTPAELFQVLLANQVLRAQGYSSVSLDIRYLMGARMDRAIDSFQPFTLEMVSRLLNGAGFTKVRGLDVHSDVSARLIRNFENVLPYDVVRKVRTTCGHPFIVCPDKGARDRVSNLCNGYHVQCSKVRDVQTGELKGFSIENHGINSLMFESVLIVDDICDGGGTFVGLAKELRKAGAKRVYLFVTHNVQRKDRLEGIDRIFTTNSFSEQNSLVVDGQGRDLTVIPISMKELK